MKATVSTLGALAAVAVLGGLCQACGGSKDHYNRRNGVGGVDSNDTGNGGSGGTGFIPSGGTGGVGSNGANVPTPGDGTNSPGTPGTGATGTGGVPGTGTPGSGTPGTGPTNTGGTIAGPSGVSAPLRAGDPAAGRTTFAFETFGNEAFWTDTLGLPQGIARAGVTPLQALELGLHVDVDALDPATQAALADELRVDPTGTSSALLNDPDATPRLLASSALIGLPYKGGRVGATCALCHTTTDASVFRLPGKGSIGRRLDGPATDTLDFGRLAALGDGSRAYYPALRRALAASGGAAPALTSEAEVDAFLASDRFSSPPARRDLTSPGSTVFLTQFSDVVYTALLDPRPDAAPDFARQARLTDLSAYLLSLDALFDRTRGVLAPHPLVPARRRD